MQITYKSKPITFGIKSKGLGNTEDDDVMTKIISENQEPEYRYSYETGKNMNKAQTTQNRLFSDTYKIICTRCNTLLIASADGKQYQCPACKKIMSLDK